MCILDNFQQESEFANPIHIGRIYYQNLATYPLWNFDSSLDYTLPLNMFMMPMNLTPATRRSLSVVLVQWLLHIVASCKPPRFYRGPRFTFIIHDYLDRNQLFHYY